MRHATAAGQSAPGRSLPANNLRLRPGAKRSHFYSIGMQEISDDRIVA
jgi:hypothetical protein